MRILELDLIAFGPFAGQRLVFPSQGPQFSIVQGPNEAGKSSALRAVHCWLFGFPHRVEDDFRHPGSRLRVGGKLQAAGGDVFHFVRRRGRDRTLLDPEGNPWEGPWPEELLGGLDRSTFCRQFAFDYDELLQGSEALLQGQGELGQALFAAAGGLTHLRKLQRAFQEQLNSRFLRQGRNPRINALCRRIEQVRTQRNELLLTAHQWQALHRQHQQAKQRCQELRQRRAELQQQQALLDISLPKTRSEAAASSDGLSLLIPKEGPWKLNGKPIEPSELPDRLRRLLAQNPSQELKLFGDKDAPFSAIVRALDLIQESGLENLKIAGIRTGRRP